MLPSLAKEAIDAKANAFQIELKATQEKTERDEEINEGAKADTQKLDDAKKKLAKKIE